MNKLILLISGLLLSSCSNAERDIFDISRDKYEAAVNYKPLYCYRSLGQIECYSEPIPWAEHRLVTHGITKEYKSRAT